MKQMLIISTEVDAHKTLYACFKPNFTLETATDGTTGLKKFQEKQYEFVFIDIMLLNELCAGESVPNYYNTFKLFFNIFPSVKIIILCDNATIRQAVDALRAGAHNYLMYPLDQKETKYIIETTLDAILMQSELDYLREEFWQVDFLDMIRTNSDHMKKLFTKVKIVAPSDTTVLITGETGTGKGIIANLIHNHSTRKRRRFISVHCGAIPENLVESEIFGHEKGAFTGAVRRKLGKFEIAHKGTIFLDEISTMPLIAQVKLLQVIQEKTFTRVGGEDTISCNVRILAASNTNLVEMIEQEKFRKDLFYRLNVFPLVIPPLRERTEDIPIIIETFLKYLNTTYQKNIDGVHDDVLLAFNQYEWPGNIRELENIIERAYLLETSQILTPESIPQELFSDDTPIAEIPLNTSHTLAETRQKSLNEIERNYLKEQLALNNGKINKTAEIAGISTRQLHKLLKKHGIQKEEFKNNKIQIKNPES
jgi:DNA-binding NtrC family response regulator